MDGQVGLKNGKLIFVEGENNPKIKVGEGVEVLVNGVKVRGSVEIKKDDKVEIKPLVIEGKRNINIIVGKDNMEAYVEISYEPCIEYELVDVDVGHEIELKGVIKNKLYKKFSLYEVENILKDKKIVYGIDREAIKRLLDGGKGLVAVGKNAIEPEDDKLIYYFGNKKVEFKENILKVDFYNRQEYDYVNAGDILVEKIEGKDGLPGFNVYGHPIKPRKRNIINLNVGVGCKVEGNKVIALVSGMPEVRSGKFVISEVIKINGDVDIKTGNIKFKGNVEITGSVKEGFKVNAGNKVIINGDVLYGDVTAIGDVIIKKNLISSNIVAGVNNLNNEQAVNNINELYNILKNVYEMYMQLLNMGKVKLDRNIGHVCYLIFESKYPNKISDIYRKNDFMVKNIKDNTLQVWNNLYELLMKMKEHVIRDLRVIQECLTVVGEFINQVEIIENKANVYLSYSQNSKIRASGNVEIMGLGCYNTDIEAKGEVKFLNEKAVLRGGTVVCELGIHAKEIGSQAGARTILKTLKTGKIEAKVVYQNTMLLFEALCYKVDYPMKSFKAYYKNGEIIVESLKL